MGGAMKNVIFKQLEDVIEEGDFIFDTENRCWLPVKKGTDEFNLVGSEVEDVLGYDWICAVVRKKQ
jgi:hypothetical protein